MEKDRASSPSLATPSLASPVTAPGSAQRSPACQHRGTLHSGSALPRTRTRIAGTLPPASHADGEQSGQHTASVSPSLPAGLLGKHSFVVAPTKNAYQNTVSHRLIGRELHELKAIGNFFYNFSIFFLEMLFLLFQLL